MTRGVRGKIWKVLFRRKKYLNNAWRQIIWSQSLCPLAFLKSSNVWDAFLHFWKISILGIFFSLVPEDIKEVSAKSVRPASEGLVASSGTTAPREGSGCLNFVASCLTSWLVWWSYFRIHWAFRWVLSEAERLLPTEASPRKHVSSLTIVLSHFSLLL